MIRTRFAPSPTGYMHIGNLRTALYGYLVAKGDKEGKFLLRIEDTDQERQVDGAVDIIYNTLKAVGLTHDEGPDVGGNYGPYVQSERLGIYKEYAEKLVELGGAHYCFCTEEDIEEKRKLAEEQGLSFKYDDPCKHMKLDDAKERIKNGEKYVIRQTINPRGKSVFRDEVYGKIEIENAILDENILLKSDGFPTYNFANVIDDHLMEITHVIRGNEYISSTPKYNLIYDAFGWETPKYLHLPPVMKDEQHKLSKRNGDASFQDLVEKGYLEEAIINYIALLGWSPGSEQEIFSLEELVKVFSIERINKAPAIFDIDKLKWMNGVYIRNLSLEEFHNRAKKYYNFTKKFDEIEISKVLQQRTELLADIPEMIDFVENLPEYSTELYVHKKMKTTLEMSKEVLQKIRPVIENIDEWTEQNIHDELMKLPEKFGLKTGQVLWPLRTAVTGKAFTPGGAVEWTYILGKEETLKRIDKGLQIL